MPLTIGSALILLCGYTFAWLAAVLDKPFMFLIHAALIGATDATLLNLVNTTIMKLFTEDSAPSFAVFRFVNSLAWSIGFGLSRVMDWKGLILLNASTMILTVISFFVLYLVVVKKGEVSYAKLQDVKDESGQAIAMDEQL